MNIFGFMQKLDYEQLVFCHDEAAGLKAIIAIHDTTLGPALGGCRMWTYNTEEEAVQDVLRLARGMTYKNAVAGLNLGGGKAVIIGDPRKDKSEALFRAFGRYVEGLNGRYITAEDVGTTVTDMDLIYQETRHVTGVSQTYGSSGNPSPMTAFGVFQGIRASLKELYGSDSLAGKKVAVQGIGNVGYDLCKLLHEEGAKLMVTDMYEDNVKRAVEEFHGEYVPPSDIYAVDCDVFAPCALGGVINENTLPQLRCRVIAGSANNQLREDAHGESLQEKGILYAPDFVINSGGVMNVADELEGYNPERARKKIENIYQITLNIFDRAKQNRIPTFKAAEKLAEERIEKMRQVCSSYLPTDRKWLKR